MKLTAAVLTLVASMLGTNAAFAQAMTTDDLKWVNQCITDNRNEGAAADVVRKYCICMNEKMDNNETRSISVWEKANPRAREACSREAGWR
jgi:hypothetical protein